MTKLLKTLLAGSALIASAGYASADDAFAAKFNYSPSDPVHVTYAQFEATAKKACKISRNDAGGVAMKIKIEALCQAQLVDDAIKATNLVTLIAYHKQQTNPAQAERRFASLN